jgi:pimeloyl-ACP methyl ester carboxylesterase
MYSVTSSDGVRIAVHDLGGEGPAIVYSHPTGFLGATWRPLADELVGYHGYGIDYRAHGDSEAPPTAEGFVWNQFRDDLLAAIDGLDLTHGEIFGVGHSMGGAVLLMAEVERPGLFRALALFEPIVFPVHPDFAPEKENGIAAGARRRRETFASRDLALANFASKPPLDVLDPEALRLYVDEGFAIAPDGTVRLKCAPEHEALTFENSTSQDAFGQLAQIKCPVLVMSGRVEAEGPSAFARPAAEALPHGSFVELAEVGHFGPMQDPAAIAAVIVPFFARFRAA